MSLLVVTYPVLSQTDYQWVQTIRATHDTLYYHVVAPHFTLVFPGASLAQEPFVAHIERQIHGVPPFRFVLRCAVLHKNPFTPSTQVFLVPDEGYSQFVTLHDRLYTGPLAPALRLDLPFIPHITVATAVDPHACKRVAETLNAQDFVIVGRVETLDIVWYDGTKVVTVEQLLLAERSGGRSTGAGVCGRTAGGMESQSRKRCTASG